jgi:hypothetical protein
MKFTRTFIGSAKSEADQEVFKVMSKSAYFGRSNQITTSSINHFINQVLLSGYFNFEVKLLDGGSETFEVIGWVGDKADGIDWQVFVTSSDSLGCMCDNGFKPCGKQCIPIGTYCDPEYVREEEACFS